jgi:hypothetical protein
MEHSQTMDYSHIVATHGYECIAIKDGLDEA